MKEKIPIVVSHELASLDIPFFFLGGGHIDLKLGMWLDDFVDKYDAIVADVTDARES